MADGQGTGPVIRVAALLILLAGPAQAYLLCLGNDTRFAIVSDGQTIQFDYVGDGTFDLTYPLPFPMLLPHENTILTAQPIPFRLSPRECTVFGVTQPLTIELTIPSNGDEVVFTGCCRDRRAE